MNNSTIPTDMFMELASDTRRDIISELTKIDLKQSQISSKFNLTIQETHRQITRLTDTGFVQRTPDGTFTLTPIGKLISKQISNFLVISKFDDHLRNHSLGDIPSKCLQNIGALLNCKVVESFTAVIEVCKSIFVDAEKYLYTITAQSPSIFEGIFEEKLENGFKIKYIYGKNTIISKNSPEITNKSNTRDLISKGSIERKMLESVNTSLIVTDKQCGLILHDPSGKLNLDMIFVADNEEFQNWCLEFFEYQWIRAGAFDINKLQII